MRSNGRSMEESSVWAGIGRVVEVSFVATGGIGCDRNTGDRGANGDNV